MRELSFWRGELMFSAVWLLVRAAVRFRQGKIEWKREALLLLMYVNLAVIIRFSFYPLDRVAGKVQPLILDPVFRLNLLPFVYLFDYDSQRELLANVIGNVCMYIPSGIILPILWKRLDRFGKVLAAGALIPLSIELLQLLFTPRTADVDDLILNLFGIAVGYGIYSLVRRPRRKETWKSGAQDH